ncbi:precorrin-3B synthase [Paraburkholderia rhizosphaerae]|uniref:precorrin-3B synthase n=1 Tax=Paraburkholderia rhizosphaerae TaxID=480658 RepID=UPI002443EC05|nr:precorrin-3B synthase [Paraburkholderia rhizosphaerae]
MNHAPANTAHSASQPRSSACPGLLRIVAARDGGICRIRLPGGALSAADARAIADAAQTHASGVVEITNRANLQIRGVRAGEEHALIERLLASGLGPHAPADEGAARAQLANPAADDVRNLMISPTAGHDRGALIDTTGLASQILALLQSEARFAALSPKFALLLDGGEHLAMLEHPHDIWLAALQGDAGDGGLRFAFGLAGCPPIAPTDEAPLAAVRPEHVIALIDALLHTFLDMAAPDDTRMREVLARQPAAAVLERVEARAGFSLLRDACVTAWRRPRAQPSLRFGAHPQREPGMSHAGGAPPLGRIDASTLRALAALSQQAGTGTLRMTPWQSVLLPDVHTHAAPAVTDGLTSLGFACDRTQPFARLIACAGSPGCAKSHTDTKADARQLAQRLPAAAEVHLSGCTRSCAAAHPVPFTLLAVEPGRYDLYQRGQPNTAARGSSTAFGDCVARHLTIEHAADLLDRLTRSPPDA